MQTETELIRGAAPTKFCPLKSGPVKHTTLLAAMQKLAFTPMVSICKLLQPMVVIATLHMVFSSMVIMEAVSFVLKAWSTDSFRFRLVTSTDQCN
jgi:hypothetical protein